MQNIVAIFISFSFKFVQKIENLGKKIIKKKKERKLGQKIFFRAKKIEKTNKKAENRHEHRIN